MKPWAANFSRTFRVFQKLCSLNFKVLLMYRASFFISFFIMGAWVLSFTLLVLIIFEHVETLAGFRKGEVLLILSFYYLFQNISDIFYKENFERFSDILRRGLFDLRLVKPVPNRFFTFFYEMRFDHASSVLMTFALFIFSLSQLETSPKPSLFLIGVGFGLIASWIYFSLLTMIAVICFWVSKNETLNHLIWHLSQISRYPRQIYGNIFQKIFTFGLPLALLAALPAEVTIDRISFSLVFYFLTIALLLSFVSRLLWEKGLRRYTSSG